MAMKEEDTMLRSLITAALLLSVSSAVAFELKEETDDQRCTQGTCVADCLRNGDVAPRQYSTMWKTGYCPEHCRDLQTYCLRHPGCTVQPPPPVAQKDVAKVLTIWCASNYENEDGAYKLPIAWVDRCERFLKEMVRDDFSAGS
jgi:hypothetical protein